MHASSVGSLKPRNHPTQAGRSATQLPGDGQPSPGTVTPQEPPSYPPVQVIRARVSSSSGSEASSINSDLEVTAVAVREEGRGDGEQRKREEGDLVPAPSISALVTLICPVHLLLCPARLLAALLTSSLRCSPPYC